MSTLETIGRQQGTYFTADELMETDFPEPRWAVPGLIAEGLTLLAGAPKLGKSWLVLGLGISTAGGTPALGKIASVEGDVLYCALEDTPRRLKSRLAKMLGGEPRPQRLTIATSLPQMPQAVGIVSEWLDEHPDARLVIVDVLGKIRPPDGVNANAYERDYAVIGQLKRLADKHSVAVVVVTHTRKMGADDAFDTVSGSTGLTGAADTTLVLRRGRGESSAVLHVTGRDVEESEYAVTFDPLTGSWSLDGNALAEAAARAETMRVTAVLGETATRVIELVSASPQGIRAKDVAESLGLTEKDSGTYLLRAERSARILRIDRGLYGPVGSIGSVGSGTGVASEEPYTSPLSYSATCTACREPLTFDNGTGMHVTCEPTRPKRSAKAPAPVIGICEGCAEPMEILEAGQLTHKECAVTA